MFQGHRRSCSMLQRAVEEDEAVSGFIAMIILILVVVEAVGGLNLIVSFVTETKHAKGCSNPCVGEISALNPKAARGKVSASIH